MKRSNLSGARKISFVTRLKVGDSVMVSGGGNAKKDRSFAGKIGKVIKFLPKANRVVLEGVGTVYRHKRGRATGESSGKILKDVSLPLSRVMFYSAEHKRPFRLRVQILANGKRVRGILNPKTKTFESVDA